MATKFGKEESILIAYYCCKQYYHTKFAGLRIIFFNIMFVGLDAYIDQ